MPKLAEQIAESSRKTRKIQLKVDKEFGENRKEVGQGERLEKNKESPDF